MLDYTYYKAKNKKKCLTKSAKYVIIKMFQERNKKHGSRPNARMEIDTMMNSKKMTKADYFRQIMTNYDITADERAFIEHELELLAKKNSAEKKPTAVQVANKGIKDAILDYMVIGEKYTVTDFMKNVDACEGLSNQRVSALVRQLKDEGMVVRTEEKRKAYFSKLD